MSRIACKFSSFSMVMLLAFATVFVAGCASATSTKEIALDQADLNSAAVPNKTTGKSAADKTDGKSNVALKENDPLAGISREATGTVVGTRVNELYGEVVRLRSQTETRAAQVAETRGSGAAGAIQYYSAVGAIQARLQQGTTPGNPILLRQWDEAQASLDQMSGAVSHLNTTSTDISADASLGGYLQDSIRAALQLSGAVDEDHAHLKQLQDVTGQQVVALDRMKTEISGELTRLNTYVATERSNMQTLAFAIEKGEFIGNNLSNGPLATAIPGAMLQPAAPALMPVTAPAYAPMPTPIAQPAMPVQYGTMQTGAAAMPATSPALVNPVELDADARSGTGMGTAMEAPASATQSTTSFDPLTQNLTYLPDESGSQTLAIIRFTDPNIAYEKQLYGAVSSALSQSSEALFTVVAVTPQAGNAAQIALGTADAQRHADDVKRSLIQMGLPPSRIAMSANGDPDARASEVRVLVR